MGEKSGGGGRAGRGGGARAGGGGSPQRDPQLMSALDNYRDLEATQDSFQASLEMAYGLQDDPRTRDAFERVMDRQASGWRDLVGGDLESEMVDAAYDIIDAKLQASR